MSLISISEINKLTYAQQSIEKSISTIIDHLKKYSNYESISKLPSILEHERQEERNQFQMIIKEVFENINSKWYFLRHNNSLAHADLKQFKNDMILIQDSIQNLIKNSKGKLKVLQVDYIDFNQDVNYYNEKLLEWSEPINLNSKDNYNVEYKSSNSRLKCVEMREFIDFVHKNGGHENGWDKDDHKLFLKFRSKYKDIEVVAKKINELLPDKDIHEIKQHEEWYKVYLILEQNKKDAIKRWQDSKNKTKSRYKLKIDENQTHSRIFNSPEDLKEKLMKWKLQKEIKFQNDINFEYEVHQRREQLESLRKKKNDEVKKIVGEWKKTKTSLEQEELLRKKNQEQNERKKRASEANKLIKQFQTQDDFYILKMKQLKKSQQNLKPLRSKSSQLSVRDPERLLKPTQQWINRVHDENIYPTEAVIPLKQLPKLGIPEWRRKV